MLVHYFQNGYDIILFAGVFVDILGQQLGAEVSRTSSHAEHGGVDDNISLGIKSDKLLCV